VYLQPPFIGASFSMGYAYLTLCSSPCVQVIEDPILAFAADGEINQLQWDASHEDWVAICFQQCVQVLKV
jgi:hypothetical protein